MKLYIVKAYEDERKLNDYADICGYYTSKTALIKIHRQGKISPVDIQTKKKNF